MLKFIVFFSNIFENLKLPDTICHSYAYITYICSNSQADTEKSLVRNDNRATYTIFFNTRKQNHSLRHSESLAFQGFGHVTSRWRLKWIAILLGELTLAA